MDHMSSILLTKKNKQQTNCIKNYIFLEEGLSWWVFMAFALFLIFIK